MPLGLCPECLIKSGFSSDAAEPAGARFIPPTVEEVAKLFPQLEILGFIGKGGMGAVYKARQPALDRFIALKVLPSAVANDPGFAERFNREARALARLNHPNIVAVHDFGQAGGLHYLLMEFVDGTNLREIERARNLSPEQALAIVPQICEALQFAHNEGIVHRDIKPENLLLDKKGRLKITDFGIAKILGLPGGKAALTGARDVVGTPHYMAPEQIEKPQTVDHRADIYSLGVVFYEMLTGELPLGKFAPPSTKVQVDVRLDEVVLHTLEKEPERRYQQASQVKTDVENITTTPPAMGFARGTGSIPTTPIPPGREGDKIILPAFLLAFFFGVFGAHRFYVGKIRTGLLQLGALLAWIPTIVAIVYTGERGEPELALFLGFLVVGCIVWAVVDWIVLLCKAFTDGQGQRITRWVHSDGRVSQPVVNPPGGTPPVPPQASGRIPGGGTGGTGMIVAPGIALVVAGILKLISALNIFLFFGWLGGDWLNSIIHEFAPFYSPWEAWTMFGAAFKTIVGLVILFGGCQMVRRQGYGWAIAAGVISIVACSLISLPIGIWALIVLAQEDVRAVFKNSTASAPPRAPAGGKPSWFVPLLVIGCVVLFFAVVASLGFAAVRTIEDQFAETFDTTNSMSAQDLQKAGIYQQGNEYRKDFSQSFPLDAHGQFSIDNVNGRIEIHGWNSNVVVLNAIIHGKAAESVAGVKIDVDSDPSRAVVHTRLPSRKNDSNSFWDWFRNNIANANVDYTVRLPLHARVENVSSVNGTAVVDGMADDITVSTVNGAARVKNAVRSLKLSTVNGTVTADMDKLGEGQSVVLDTVNGRIELAVPDNADAKFSIDTVNGRIRSDFPELAVKKEFHVGSNLNGSLRNGAASVRASTVNGAIEIRKVPAVARNPVDAPVVKPPDVSSNSAAGQSSAR